MDILRGQVNNASSITVSWDSLPCSHQHGRTIGYNVRYTSASLSRSISISSSNIEVSAEVSVSPFTEYEFEVAAIWENDDIGPYTPPITLFSPAEGEFSPCYVLFCIGVIITMVKFRTTCIILCVCKIVSQFEIM